MKPARDEAYLRRVRRLPCCVCPRIALVAHHSTVGRGIGQKASDYDTMPLCHEHHDAFHRGVGHFAGWERQQRRDWQIEQVEATRLTLHQLQYK